MKNRSIIRSIITIASFLFGFFIIDGNINVHAEDKAYTLEGTVIPDQMKKHKSEPEALDDKLMVGDDFQELDNHQIDCQALRANETGISKRGKEFTRLICFYDVVVQDKHYVFWHEVGSSDRFGFLNKP